MPVKTYDVVVVGGGAAGLVAAVAAGAFGARTALVEIDRLGGECSWTGCVPSKALIAAASLAHRSGHIPGNVMEHVLDTVQKASKSSKARNLLKRYQVDLLFGPSAFKNRNTLELPDTTITAGKFILCTGSSALRPDIPGLRDGYLTNREVWDLPAPPASLLVIGGGPIGTELAQAFHRLGTKVTLIHSRDRLLPRDDAELAGELTGLLAEDGLDIRLNSRVREVEKTETGWRVNAGSDNLFGEHLLVSLGRTANAEGLNLEAAGVEFSREQIKTDKYLRTTAPNIWAAGDCTGGLRFSHIAEIEAKTAVRNALFPFNSRPDYQGAPWATFTDPELAHLGLTEEECKEQNLKYSVYYQPFAGDDRAIADETTDGRVKILSSPLGKLLGVHILGPRAGELINEFVLARRKGLRLHDIGLTAHVYPTLGLAGQRAADEWFAGWAAHPWAKQLFRMFRR
ncbi:MAG: NAD(P)/FAD-dependent oxidoreductase [Clostridiales bacterium]|nr:NAD(P)/FAD-dependent oxidoreductase [Clostridiales bacterium]